MATDVNKYLEHGLSDPLIKFYQDRAGDKQLLSLPICPRCERAGLRDKGWAIEFTMCCPHCGYRGKATHQLSTYVKSGLYK